MADEIGLLELFIKCRNSSPRARDRELARVDPVLAQHVRDLLSEHERSDLPESDSFRNTPTGWTQNSRTVKRGPWFSVFIGLDMAAAAFYIYFFAVFARYVYPTLSQGDWWRAVCYVVVSFAFAFVAAFLGYVQPGDPRVRYAYGALLAEALCLLSSLLLPVMEMFHGWRLATFHALMTFDGLNLPLAYHFYLRFFQNELGTAKGESALRLVYVWTALTLSYRLVLLAGGLAFLGPTFETLWFDSFYIGLPALICVMIGANYHLLNHERSRSRIRVFILCSIAGVLPYGVSRALRIVFEVPSLSQAHVSFAGYVIEIAVVLSIALIPIAAGHAILFKNMFEIALRRSLLVEGLPEGALALAISALLFSLFRNRQQTIAAGMLTNAPFIATVMFAVIMYAVRHTARRWLLSHSENAPTLGECPVCGRCYGPAAKACRQESALLRSRQIPLTLGDRYRLEQKIGEGGTSLVYRAQDVALERPVAIKILHPEYASNRDLVRRVQREALAVAKLNHPNIVKVQEFKHSGDLLVFLVMEFVEGEPLSRWLAARAISRDTIADCFVQIYAAVEATHRKGIVHRDLKPDNVLITDLGEGRCHVTLLDFGIARLQSAAGDTRLTRTGMFVGTILYSPPEQRINGPIDNRTDIYSLGVMLFQTLTGSLPFPGDTDEERIRSVLGNSVCLDNAAGLGPTLLTALRKSLALNPADRFQNVAELRNAVIPGLHEFVKLAQ